MQKRSAEESSPEELLSRLKLPYGFANVRCIGLYCDIIWERLETEVTFNVWPEDVVL
jgi:hypothetical protein